MCNRKGQQIFRIHLRTGRCTKTRSDSLYKKQAKLLKTENVFIYAEHKRIFFFF